MRKYPVYAATWVLCAFVLTLHAMAQDDFIFRATFDDDAVGKAPKDWKPTPVGKIEVVKSEDLEHGNVVQITDTGSGGGMARQFPEQKSGVISIEYEILKRPGSTGGDVELLYVSNSKLGDLTGVDVAMTNGPKSRITYHNRAWQQGPELTTDEWHLLTYRIDIDKEKWAFEYDGKKVDDALAFRDFAAGSFDRLNFANILDGGSTFELLVDDLMIYGGVKRPTLAVQPRGKAATVWARLKASR